MIEGLPFNGAPMIDDILHCQGCFAEWETDQEMDKALTVKHKNSDKYCFVHAECMEGFAMVHGISEIAKRKEEG